MGTLRPCLPFSALLAAALGVVLPAGAETYKWVDEKGVVTYSNSPPPDAKRAKKVEVVPERVSVYAPDPELSRAMQPDAKRDAKIASLGQQLEAERAKRHAQDARPGEAERQAAYSRCIAQRGVDCDAQSGSGADSYYGPGYGYYYPYVAHGGRHRPRPFRVLDTPNSVIGINPAPPVGISTAPPVGAQPPSYVRVNPLRQPSR